MRLICALLIALVLGTTPAFADYEPVHLPQCKLYKTIDGQEVCGYSLEGWKSALKVDAELVTTKFRLKKETERTGALSQQVTALREQVSVYAESQIVLVDRSNKLTQDIISLDKKYQTERVKPRFGSPVAWTLAAVSTSVLAGFAISSIVD